LNNRRLAEQDIQDFIFDHEKDDEDRLVLKSKKVFSGFHRPGLQYRSRQEKIRLQNFRCSINKRRRVPPSLNLEQSSSEATARFKKHITSKWITSGKNSATPTGGFGVDSLFLPPCSRIPISASPTKTCWRLRGKIMNCWARATFHYHDKSAS